MYDGEVFMAQMGHFVPIGDAPQKKIYDQIKKLGENSESLVKLRSHVAINLHTTILLKQYERIFNLYDCLEDNIDWRTERKYKTFICGAFALTPPLAFLAFKKIPMFHFDSWISHLKILAPISFLSLSFIYLIYSKLENRNYNYKFIVITKYQLHSQIININNKLRFDEKEFR